MFLKNLCQNICQWAIAYLDNQQELPSGPVSGDGHWEARSVVDSVEQSEGNQDTRIYEFEDNEGGEGPLSPENSQGLFLCFLIDLKMINYSLAYYQNFLA